MSHDSCLPAPRAVPLPGPLESALIPEPATVLLRATSNRRCMDAWTLVLLAKGVQPVLRWSDGVCELHVAPGDVERARAELQAADTEDMEVRRAAVRDAKLEEPPATRHALKGALWVALLLLAFHAITGPRASGSDWFSAGASNAERVLQGEWWRTVTALTLHADSAHVISNVGIGTLAVGAVMRSKGVGWGAALVLAAGTAGNFVNAWAQHTHHDSVGFSTAVFGAIGLLGGLAYVHGRRRVRKRRPAWTALGGSLALLALLGSSEQSDLFAHLFGGLAGTVLGLVAGWSGVRPRTTIGQWMAGLATASVVVTAWVMALV